MTIAKTGSSASYAGNGVTVAFSFPFRFFDDTDLKVYIVAADGTSTLQTLTTDYSISNAGDETGGTVTMVTAPASTETLLIEREVPETQSVDYQNNDAFPAETHEQALDRLTLLVQQQSRGDGLHLTFPTGDTNSPVLPTSSLRANKLLGFGTGGAIETYDTTTGVIDTEFDTVADLLASTKSFDVGVYVRVKDGDFTYKVVAASSGKTIQNSATTPVNFEILPTETGYYLEQWGDPTTGDAGLMMQTAHDAVTSFRWKAEDLTINTQVNITNFPARIEGPGRDVCMISHLPVSANWGFNLEAASGSIRNVFIGGFSIEGSAVSGTAVGYGGLRADHFKNLRMDINFFRYERSGGDGVPFKLTGGDIDLVEFSSNWEWYGDAETVDNGPVIGDRSDADHDGPVNTGAGYNNRIARSGGGSGVGVDFQKGFANFFYGVNVEGFADAFEVNDFGNGVVTGDIENNDNVISFGADVLDDTEYRPEFDISGTTTTDPVAYDHQYPWNNDTYNGLIANRSVHASPRNCVINGDFYEGAAGAGKWSSTTVVNDSNAMFDHGWVHEMNASVDPSGDFVFDADTFKPNTWYTLLVWAKGDSGITANGGFRVRVGAGDTGYKSGTSDLDGEALYLVGNQRRSNSLQPSNSMDTDDLYRPYILPFYTGSNTAFPAELEVYAPGAPTGGSVWVGAVGVFEGTGVLEFQLSNHDIKYRSTTEPSQTSATALTELVGNTTLGVGGGTAYCDASGGAFNVTLPDASDAGRGTQWTVIKTETSANRVNMFPKTGEEINGATGGHDLGFFDGAYSSKTFESNGIDGWTVVASFK